MKTYEEDAEAGQEAHVTETRCIQGINMGQVGGETRLRRVSEDGTHNILDSEHIEIREDIEDAEPTFYNDTRNIQLQLNESPSSSGTKEEETESATSSNKQKSRL